MSEYEDAVGLDENGNIIDLDKKREEQKQKEEKEEKRTQAEELLEAALSADLFHSADKTPYADIEINGHRETYACRTKGFRRWLVRQFYEQTHKAPGSDAIQAALNLIEAKGVVDWISRKLSV